MKTDRDRKKNADVLRQQAEEKLSQQSRHEPSEDAPDRDEMLRLLHELEIHQVELELQNVELQHSRSELESLLSEYSDLYDFAPVGYFSLDADGSILRVNLTGARLLGQERGSLIKRRLEQYITFSHYTGFNEFLFRVFSGMDTRETCEVKLISGEWVELQADCVSGAPECKLVMQNISARKQALDDLTLFKTIFDRSSEACAISNPDGQLVYINKAHEDLFGRPLAHAQKLLFSDFYPPESQETLQREVPAAIARGKNWEGELEALSSDGRRFPIWIRSDAIFDDQKKLRYSFGFMHDISARKKAERDQRNANMELEQAQAVAHLGSWKWNLEAAEVEWSDEMFRIFGIDKATYSGRLGDVISQVIHPDDLHIVLPANAAEFSSKKPQEYRIIRPSDGATRIIWAKAGKTILDKAGNPLYLTGIALDITDSRQTEQALRSSEERHRLISGLISDYVYIGIADQQGNTTTEWVSGPFEQTTGYSLEELQVIPGGYGSLVLAEDMPDLLKKQARLLAGENMEAEYRITRRDGEIRWLRDTIKPIATTGQQIRLLGAVKDITESKKAEAALMTSEKKLKSLIDSQTHFVIRTDLQGNYTYWNPKFEQEFGWIHLSPDASAYNTIAPYHQARVTEVVTNCLTHPGQVFSVEIDKPARNGGMRSTLWEFTCLTDEHDQPSELQCMGIEITERKTAEEALRKSNERFNSLFHNIPFTGVIYRLVRDADGKIVDWIFSDINVGGAESLGMSSADLIGKSSIAMFGEQVMEPYLQICREVEAEKKPRLFETHFETNQRDYLSSVFMVGDDYYANVAMDVTERNQALAALRQSEIRYHSLFDNSPIAIWEENFSRVRQEFERLRQAGISDLRVYLREQPERVNTLASLIQIDEINQASFRMLGANSQAEVLKDLPAYFSESSLPVFEDEMVALFEGKTWFHGEIPVINIHKEGVILDLSLMVEPGCEDSLARVIVSFQDITERKQAEEALRASQEKYRGLLESLDSAVVTVDAQGRYLYVNEVAAYQMHSSVQKLRGKTLYDLLPKPLANEQMAEIHRVMQNDQGKVMETISNIRGIPRWCRVSIQPIHDENGQVAYALINTTDIDDLKSAQQELRELNQTLELRVRQRTAEVQDLYDNAPAGYHSIDPQAILIRINQTELTWLGRTREEVLGHSIEEFLSPESRPNFRSNFPIFKKQGVNKDFELEFVRKDGSVFPILINSVAILDEKGDFEMSRSTVLDNTERKAAEKALQRAFLELERALRMKDEFLATMSHELRTPLTSILGLAEILTLGYHGQLNEQQKKFVANIDTSGWHLLSLINDLLDISKIEAGKLDIHLEPGSIIDVCNSSLNFVKTQAVKKNIRLDFFHEEDVRTVLADQKRLKQILVNLLSNAVKFTPAGGEVELRVHAEYEQKRIIFAISDTGIGISESDLRRLFTPFTQVDSSLSRQYEGTGLGLALVKRLVELHNGSVTVSSQVGVGSTFAVALPWEPGSQPVVDTLFVQHVSDGSTKRSSRVVTGSNGNILLAEDNTVNQAAMVEFLQSRGYQVYTAINGFEVLKIMETTRPDLILMDIHMPEMDGLETMRHLRSEPANESIPIFALTALAMPGDRDKCIEAGADEYICKPIRLRELGELIENALKKS
jgi:PAS domain S-box-containing protein